jgi:hypothetical protein
MLLTLCATCNVISTVYSVAAILYLQSVLHVMLLTLCATCNVISMVYSLAAVLYLQSVLHVMLFRPWNMFCTVTSALPAVCVQWPVWLFVRFLNFVLSRYVAQLLPEWYWNGSSRPYYYRFQSPLLLPVPVAPITSSSRPYYYQFQSPLLLPVPVAPIITSSRDRKSVG